MPLLNLGGEKTVSIDGDEYTLRTVVSWVARQKCSTSKGMVFYVKRRDLENGMRDMSPEDLVPMSMDSDEDTSLLRLETWLVKWSHPDALNRKNLERLPSSHVRFLLSEIAQLEKEQDGPAPDSPLDGDSNG